MENQKNMMTVCVKITTLISYAICDNNTFCRILKDSQIIAVKPRIIMKRLSIIHLNFRSIVLKSNNDNKNC